MKNIKYIFSLLCLALVVFACEDNYDRSAGGDTQSKAPVLSLGQNSVVILTPDAEANNPFLFRINWSKPRISYENGLPVEVSDLKYTLEMDMLGNLFANPKEVGTTDLLYTDVYSTPLTNLVVGFLGSEPTEAQNFEFRVKTTYQIHGAAAEPLYSNAVTLIVVPYVEPTIPEVDEVTIKWKQTTGDWEAFAVYAWGAEEVFGSWPGQAVTPDEDGWYSIVVPGKRPVHLIMNNNGGGKQFDFLEDPTESASYEINTTDGTWTLAGDAEEVQIKWKQVTGDWSAFAVYSWGGTPNFEAFGSWPGKVVKPSAGGWYSLVVPGKRPINMIMNNNSGGKQFDFLKDPTEGGSYEINSTDGTWTKVDDTADEVTIRWKYVGSDWTAFGIYAWGGSPAGDTFGSWPGRVVTPDKDGWCSVTVPAGQTVGNVIFNNTTGGSGNQFDVKLHIIGNVCFEITSNSYKVVDCQ